MCCSLIPTVSFPDNFLLSGGKICLVIRLFCFGSSAQEYWCIFHFNLTRDATFLNSSSGKQAVNDLEVDGVIQAAGMSFLRSDGRGEESLLCYPLLLHSN